MTTVLIVAHHDRSSAHAAAETAIAWLTDAGHQVVVHPDDAAAVGHPALVCDDAVGRADLCLTMGGDGTILRAVHLMGDHQLPLIGVNLGWLGYLTEIEPAAIESSLQRWLGGPVGGDWQIEERMMLAVTVDAGGTTRDWVALNEAVIERREPGHTIRMQVSIAGAPFTSYAADGFIVATPTGSTAYSFSARGPVVSPRHRAVLLTPVAAHMLFDRSLVLTADEIVEIELLGYRPAVLTVDGQAGAELATGDTVTVAAADTVARFVRFGERRFHQILKAKFELPDR